MIDLLHNGVLTCHWNIQIENKCWAQQWLSPFDVLDFAILETACVCHLPNTCGFLMLNMYTTKCQTIFFFKNKTKKNKPVSLFLPGGLLTTYIHTKDLTVLSIKIKGILMAMLQAIWSCFHALEQVWTLGKRHSAYTGSYYAGSVDSHKIHTFISSPFTSQIIKTTKIEVKVKPDIKASSKRV